MSQENIKKFYLAVVQDPAMKEQILTAPDRSSLVSTAVKLGKEKGYSFTEPDVENWLTTSANQSRPDGLSDIDLQSVAGGKENEALSHGLEVAGGVTPAAPVLVPLGAITCLPHEGTYSMSITQASASC